jgi:hypothetical protein
LRGLDRIFDRTVALMGLARIRPALALAVSYLLVGASASAGALVRLLPGHVYRVTADVTVNAPDAVALARLRAVSASAKGLDLHYWKRGAAWRVVFVSPTVIDEQTIELDRDHVLELFGQRLVYRVVAVFEPQGPAAPSAPTKPEV